MSVFASSGVLLRIVSCTAVAAAAGMTWSAPAHADACGSRVLTPTEVTISIDPPVDCLVASLEGTDHAGCDNIRVVIENGCSADAEVLETNVQCHEREASEVQTSCSTVPPGSASFVFAGEVVEGANEVDVDVQIDGTTHVIHVEYVAVGDGESTDPGCSIALPGRARGGVQGLGLAAAAAAIAAARRRIRERAR